jgi:hypothetical protein
MSERKGLETSLISLIANSTPAFGGGEGAAEVKAGKILYGEASKPNKKITATSQFLPVYSRLQ